MFNDLTGRKFGKLTVIKLDHKKHYESNGKSKGFMYYWLCKCDCGNIKVIRGVSLTTGHTKSCGCLYSSQNNLSKTRLYKILEGIKGRCLYPKNNRYEFYGAKGVSICQEWLDNFQNFYNWAMENGYKDNLTIDRIDINGNYEPLNCRWVDIKTQARNKSNNKLITYNGQTLCVTEWAEILNIKPRVIRDRLRRGWEIERIFTTSPKNL